MGSDAAQPDWRATLIQAVHEVFTRERDLYLQELRTFMAARGELTTSEANRFESRLHSLVSEVETTSN